MGDNGEESRLEYPPKESAAPSPIKDGTSVPSGFVLKLYQMVNGAPDDVISWLPSGDAFKISDLRRLETETLPAFFRHKRFQSLVRQLNFYNFRKVNRERTFWVYRHPLFQRDRPSELHLLRRRTCPGADGRRCRTDPDAGSASANANANANGGVHGVDGAARLGSAYDPSSLNEEESAGVDDGGGGNDTGGPFEDVSSAPPPKKRKKTQRPSILSVSSDLSSVVGQDDAAVAAVAAEAVAAMSSSAAAVASAASPYSCEEAGPPVAHSDLSMGAHRNENFPRPPHSISSYLSASDARVAALAPATTTTIFKADLPEVEGVTVVGPAAAEEDAAPCHVTPDSSLDRTESGGDGGIDGIDGEMGGDEVADAETDAAAAAATFPPAMASYEAPVRREHPLLPNSACASDSDDGGSGCGGGGREKFSRTERAERSALVSQVARQLEAHIRRVTNDASYSSRKGRDGAVRSRSGGGSGGSAAAGGGVSSLVAAAAAAAASGNGGVGSLAGAGLGTVTPPRITDTMKYNALTYDDEIVVGEESDDYAALERMARGEDDDAANSVLVVTDGDDSSEEEWADGSSKKKKRSKKNKKRSKSKKAKKCSGAFSKAGSATGRDDLSSKDHATNNARNESATGATAPTEEELSRLRLRQPPVADPVAVASVGRKLLDRLPLREDDQAGTSCRENGHVAATVAGFCMSTAPLDDDLPAKVLGVMSSCAPLAHEFLRYRFALDPMGSVRLPDDKGSGGGGSGAPSAMTFHQQNLALRKFLDGPSRREETMRDFKVFVVNCLDELVGDGGVIRFVGFRENELSALRHSIASWSSSISIQ